MYVFEIFTYNRFYFIFGFQQIIYALYFHHVENRNHMNFIIK